MQSEQKVKQETVPATDGGSGWRHFAGFGIRIVEKIGLFSAKKMGKSGHNSM